MIKAKRIYEPLDDKDGFRILIDRLWPRGLKKETSGIDKWAKEIAPSTNLRKEFHHHPEKWTEFKKKYLTELKENKSLPEFENEVKNHHTVTLLYASRDEQHNHAVILRDFLERNRR